MNVMMAAGSAILKFSLNLSAISQPCVRVAAMVVSEIIDRLSPNMAPPTMAPRHSAPASSVLSATPQAMGASAAMVPTDVPIEMEMKHAIRNKPGNTMPVGKMDSAKFTVLSTPPADCTEPVKAPASTNTRHMIMTLESPMDRATLSSFSSNERLGFWMNATASAHTNATMAGML